MRFADEYLKLRNFPSPEGSQRCNPTEGQIAPGCNHNGGIEPLGFSAHHTA